VQKCEVNKSGLRNSLKRVWNRCSSGKDGVKTTLLHPMKITIPEGITAIIGTAESGKSTLLKFMAGCLNNNVECVGDGESYCYLHTVILCSDLWINTAMFRSSLSVLTS
jgi:ABC-type polysaccharide/polyol phosphate transport system ATPase subunit